jgi:hypothetical protein
MTDLISSVSESDLWPTVNPYQLKGGIHGSEESIEKEDQENIPEEGGSHP